MLHSPWGHKELDMIEQLDWTETEKEIQKSVWVSYLVFAEY